MSTAASDEPKRGSRFRSLRQGSRSRSPPESRFGDMQPTSSVRSVVEGFGQAKVSAQDVLGKFCELHADYMDGKAGTIAAEMQTSAIRASSNYDSARNTERLNPYEWVDRVSSLVNPGAEGLLDTRRMILGLALLDAGAFWLLWIRDCFPALFKEIRGEEQSEQAAA
jgi:hypothetical protein